MRRTPWVTYALIAANVVVFLLTPVARAPDGQSRPAAQCRQAAFYDRYAAIPRELVHNRPLSLVPTGQTASAAQGVGCVLERPTYHKSPALSVLCVDVPARRLAAPARQHAVPVGLRQQHRGPDSASCRFPLFYLVCGYVAAYGFALANPNSMQPLIGASGAIAGVLGAYLVLYPRAKVWSLVPFLFFIPLRLPAWLVLGGWFVLQWVYASGYAASGPGGVAYLAHVFGFLAGRARRPARPCRVPAAPGPGPPPRSASRALTV